MCAVYVWVVCVCVCVCVQIPETVSGLHKVRDRKYGRTWVAVYASPSEGELEAASQTAQGPGDEWDEELEL